jgi:hypothetical protein
VPRILIANLARCLIEEKPLQAQQRPNHVFADSLCLSLGCSPDLTVDVETCVAPAEDFLDKGKADKLFPKQQGKDLVGEDFLDNLVMETTETMESAIRGCAPFGNQYMDMGMEIDAITEGLDHSHHSWHELKTCGCVQGFHKCTHRAETEIIEEFSLEAEEKTQHLRNSKDNLTVGDIEQKLLPHPLAPFLTSLRMARGAESAGFAGKHEEALLSTVGTPDTGKTAHRIAAVEILLNNILNNRAKKAILSLKA